MIGDNDTALRSRALGLCINKVPDRTRPPESARRRDRCVFKAVIEIGRLQVVMEFDVVDFHRLAIVTDSGLEVPHGRIGGAIVDPAGSIRVHVCPGHDRGVPCVPSPIR